MTDAACDALLPVPLFNLVDTVDVPAVDRFDVNRIRFYEIDGVKFGLVDHFITLWFDGLVEEAQAARTLRRNELTCTASCSTINEALGNSAEITWGQVLWMMANNKIHKNGKATIFRVRDKSDTLRFGVVGWQVRDSRWCALALKTDEAGEWKEFSGVQVFSRNSLGV